MATNNKEHPAKHHDVPTTRKHDFLHLNDHQVPLVGVFLTSMIELIATKVTLDDNHRYYEYAISVGAVGMCLSALGLVMLEWFPRFDSNFGKINGLVIWLWTFLAACLLTFGDNGTFTNPGNGYFAVWGMLAFATNVMGVTAKDIKNSAYDGSALMALGVASVVLLIALSFELAGDQTYKTITIYSLLLAILTLIFVERLRDVNTVWKSFAILVLGIAWTVAASYMTFRGPFTETGNGYFAAWGCVVTCVYSATSDFMDASRTWLYQCFGRYMDDDNDDDNNNGNKGNTSDVEAPKERKLDLTMIDTLGSGTDSGTNNNNSSSQPYYENLSTPSTFKIQVDMPGVHEDDLEIELESDRRIKVKGIRGAADDASTTRTFGRTFPIDPQIVDVEKLEAALESGILTLSAPKKHPPTKKIKLTKSNSSSDGNGSPIKMGITKLEPDIVVEEEEEEVEEQKGSDDDNKEAKVGV